jgi:hypothetical protein
MLFLPTNGNVLAGLGRSADKSSYTTSAETDDLRRDTDRISITLMRRYGGEIPGTGATTLDNVVRDDIVGTNRTVEQVTTFFFGANHISRRH